MVHGESKIKLFVSGVHAFDKMTSEPSATFVEGVAGPSARGGAFEVLLAPTDLESVPAVGGFDEENVAPNHAEHATNGCRHVFVEPVGELDDDHRSLPGRPHQATGHCPRATAQLAKYDQHNPIVASGGHTSIAVCPFRFVRNAGV